MSAHCRSRKRVQQSRARETVAHIATTSCMIDSVAYSHSQIVHSCFMCMKVQRQIPRSAQQMVSQRTLRGSHSFGLHFATHCQITFALLRNSLAYSPICIIYVILLTAFAQQDICFQLFVIRSDVTHSSSACNAAATSMLWQAV